MALVEGLGSLEGLPGYGAKKGLCLKLGLAYPVLHVAALLGPQDKRPKAFQQEHPGLSFARVVLPESRIAVWFFSNATARDRYRRWCMSPEDNRWERPDPEHLPLPPPPSADAVPPLS